MILICSNNCFVHKLDCLFDFLGTVGNRDVGVLEATGEIYSYGVGHDWVRRF